MEVKNKIQKNETYLGFDIGTNSIGWAVTDCDYNVLNFKNKAMWGARLFDPAKTATERRIYRSNRRRLDRRTERIKLLQQLFSEEITKVDESFFIRLNESSLHLEDKENTHSKYSLFNDASYTDKDYHKDFPTIYHLRKALMDSDKKQDIRLIYLAIHNIIKYRGHFLYEGQTIKSVDDFNLAEAFESVNRYMLVAFEDGYTPLNLDKLNELDKIITNKKLNVTSKKKQLEEVFSVSTPVNKEIIALLAGGTATLGKIFIDRDYDEAEIKKITFADSSYEMNLDAIMDTLGDDFEVVENLKAIYDLFILKSLLKGRKYLSYARVEDYEKHKYDLKVLKRLIKANYSEEDFNAIFGIPVKSKKDTEKTEEGEEKEESKSNISKPTNYTAYIAHYIKNGKKIDATAKKCNQDDFYKFLKKVLVTKEDELKENAEYVYVMGEIESRTFLPKQVSKENSTIPYQLHQMELEKILDNASKHYEFLNTKSDGYTTSEKIVSILKFRVPYYVGPLKDDYNNKQKEGFSWVVRNSHEKVTPWNFDKVIDKDKSENEFIKRMTNKCTYLIGEDVLPKNSLLYSEFMVLNELNNLRINAVPITVELKNKIFNKLFKNKKKVTMSTLKSFLVQEGVIARTEKDNTEITGIDGDFKASLNSYIAFKSILQTDSFADKYEMIEDIINSINIISDKNRLEARIKKDYGKALTQEQIKQIKGLSFSGWGRLSKELLRGLESIDKQTGEIVNIISLLRSTNQNFMEIIHDKKYGFNVLIDEHNKQLINTETSYDMVEKLNFSPAVKRQVWQTLLVAKELKKVLKTDPKKIFIEMAREEGEKKRTESRKDNLIKIYESCKADEVVTSNYKDKLKERLEKEDNDNLKSKKLYLYYLQMGRCMYSGREINLDTLFTDQYDIDHIVPRSKVKDDSFDNLVLVEGVLNKEKTDEYPIRLEIRQAQKPFWNYLKSCGFKDKQLMSKEKYERLIRSTPLSESDLTNFINRQIVETRQTTKLAAELITNIFPESKIVYVKAGNVSDFRNNFDILKVREVNDLHHAKDAYFNIVVGNVYNAKFGWNARDYFAKNDYANRTYNLAKMYNWNVKGAWVKDNDESISRIKKYANQNNCLITQYSYKNKGEFYGMQAVSKKEGLIQIDSKMNDTSKYGGYTGVRPAYFVLVKYVLKGKEVKEFVSVPLYLSSKLITKEQKEDYCKEMLNVNTVEILMDEIKIKSLLKIKNSYAYIAGETGDSLVLHNANQLYSNIKNDNYLKKIVNFVTKKELVEKKNKNATVLVRDNDEITLDGNIGIYESITNKLNYNTYLGISNMQKQLHFMKNQKEIFKALPLEVQASVILEILKIFSCNSLLGNLKAISGAKFAGGNNFSKRVSASDNLKLINQSITGLFDNSIEINRL
ncbi:MAG: type II CRISPR RNA-guided endonuclease Cas9 [Spirochaetales bacterium]